MLRPDLLLLLLQPEMPLLLPLMLKSGGPETLLQLERALRQEGVTLLLLRFPPAIVSPGASDPPVDIYMTRGLINKRSFLKS